ncbi:MAG TPA: HupE/UreJ family protein [Verrucomicrobium sp.]|nr:HupE/UreJ family protein [Verrucomicrobium sp.]
MSFRTLLKTSLPLAALTFAQTLSAHPGHYHPEGDQVDEFDVESFFSAVAHPFTGLDHMVAAVAVGFLAFTMGRRMGLALSALFLGMLAVGSAVGRAGLGVPMLEQGLALSVVGLGLMLMFYKSSGSALRLAIVAAMGFWHGNAHGLENAGGLFAMGLWLGTLLVVGCGTLLALPASRLTAQPHRFAGAAVAIAGAAFCIALFA